MTQPYPCPYPCPSPGAMEELPEKTHAVAEGVQLRIALVSMGAKNVQVRR